MSNPGCYVRSDLLSQTFTKEQEPYDRTGAEVDRGRIAVHKRRRQRDWPHTENPCCGINELERYPINRVGYSRPSNHVEKLMGAATVGTDQKPGQKGQQCGKGRADREPWLVSRDRYRRIDWNLQQFLRSLSRSGAGKQTMDAQKAVRARRHRTSLRVQPPIQ